MTLELNCRIIVHVSSPVLSPCSRSFGMRKQGGLLVVTSITLFIVASIIQITSHKLLNIMAFNARNFIFG
jgi:hypothetical protein